MSRILTFVAIGIVVTVAIFSRRLSIQLLGPNSQMWAMVAEISFGSISGEAWAQRMYEAVTVWVPWFLISAAVLGGLYREFARTNITRGRGR